MPSLKEMQTELRELRKASAEHKAVSRMRKGDIAAEIQKMKGMREETPAVAAIPSAPTKKSKAAVESIKEAKKMEFPIKPEDKAPKANPITSRMASGKSSVAAGDDASKKKDKMAKLMKLMEMMGEDDE